MHQVICVLNKALPQSACSEYALDFMSRLLWLCRVSALLVLPISQFFLAMYIGCVKFAKEVRVAYVNEPVCLELDLVMRPRRVLRLVSFFLKP